MMVLSQDAKRCSKNKISIQKDQQSRILHQKILSTQILSKQTNHTFHANHLTRRAIANRMLLHN